MNRAELSKLRNSQRYRRARARYLADHPLCAECDRQGLVRAADHLDHIKPVHQGGDFWNQANWQGLCKACHVEKTAREQSLLDAEGWQQRREWTEHLRRYS